MGRTKIDIDWELVDQLLAAGCNGMEISATLGICNDTLYRKVEEKFQMTFTAYSIKKKSIGDSLLKKTQFEKANGISNKGDNTLLIWLGKQRLGQKETIEENKFPEDFVKNFGALMTQLDQLQSARKIADINISNEQKSA